MRRKSELAELLLRTKHDKDYPRIQILTVEGILNGTERINAPPQLNPFAMAARESTREKQTEML
jgi:hypothetical protein